MVAKALDGSMLRWLVKLIGEQRREQKKGRSTSASRPAGAPLWNVYFEATRFFDGRKTERKLHQGKLLFSGERRRTTAHYLSNRGEGKMSDWKFSDTNSSVKATSKS
jgi:hypothetical protein